MASQPQDNLPLFYNNIQPLSSSLHQNFRARITDKAPFFATTHATPLTVDEFINAQRFMPIVFSSGPNSVPLALTGLNEGVNVFIDDEGKPYQPFYVPAYVRRYPYVLARTQPDAQELSLCYDASSDLVGSFDEGEALFDGDQPSEHLKNVLKFCEDFEIAGQRTSQFMTELEALNILMDGEVAIQPDGMDKPYVYRGFRMVDEQKFRDLNGDQLRKLSQNGIMPLIVAHLFSLSLVRDIFGRQMQLGKVPAPEPETPQIAF